MPKEDIARCLHSLQLELKDHSALQSDRLRLHVEKCFPAVREISGRRLFDIIVANFVLRSKALRPDLSSLENFPCIIHELLEVHRLPALCSVATLELRCVQALLQAEARPLNLKDLVCCSEGELLSGHISLHPTAAIVCSVYPVVTLWISRQRGPGILDCATEWPEAALVLRPGAELAITRLTLGLHSFLRALRSGLPVAAAAEYARVRDGLFQFPADLWRLLEVGAFSRFDAEMPRATGLRQRSRSRSLQ